jgi:anti-sigma regulatory factor (Ser/Thr protein kinase)
MTAEMTPSARTDRHPDFEHVAVYHEGDDDLAEQLLPDIAHALGEGDAVLVCSPPGVWDRISARLGQVSADIEYVPDAVRYAHPNVAMRILTDFVRDRTRNGARAAWSIGAIPFNGDGVRNAAWVRYEQAVNEVLQHLPLRAICTYDVGRTPPELVDEARCVHSNLDGTAASVRHADGHHAVPPIALPSDEPLLQLHVHSSRSARHTVAEAYRELISDDALGDLTLIVSEVVSNALDHGAPPVTLSAWHDAADASSVIDVSDHGLGIDDPFVDLRPPQQRPGGAGMWIVGQLSERVASQRIGDAHHVTVAVSHRAQPIG